MEGRRAGRGGGEERDERFPPAHCGWLWPELLVFAFGGAAGLGFCRVATVWYRWPAAKALSPICIDLASLSVLKLGQVASQELVELLWRQPPRGVPPPIYECGRTNGQVRKRYPRLGTKFEKPPLLARGGLADAAQVRLVRPEADPEARRPEVALQRLLEPLFKRLVREELVVALRDFKDEVLVVPS